MKRAALNRTEERTLDQESRKSNHQWGKEPPKADEPTLLALHFNFLNADHSPSLLSFLHSTIFTHAHSPPGRTPFTSRKGVCRKSLVLRIASAGIKLGQEQAQPPNHHVVTTKQSSLHLPSKLVAKEMRAISSAHRRETFWSDTCYW